MNIPITTPAPEEPGARQPHADRREAGQNAATQQANDPAASAADLAYVALKADYDNLRKRCEREASQQAEHELSRFLIRFLSIYDDFERALRFCQSLGPAASNADLTHGICLIKKQFEELLRDYQVERIDAVGKRFDPLYHEAVMMEPASGDDPDTVKREILAGYLFRHKLLRPARVSVAR